MTDDGGLGGERAATGTGEQGTLQGRVVGVERLPAEEVPDDYPVEVDADEALRVDVRPVEAADSTAVYFEWPPADDGQLDRLLDLRDVWQDRVDELEGEPIPLAVEDGYFLPNVPEDRTHGSPVAIYGLLVGLPANAALLGGVLFGLLPPTPSVVVTAVLLNVIVLPAATYLDAWHLRSHSDWDQGPLFWAAMAGFVGLNVFTTVAYLWSRRRATPA